MRRERITEKFRIDLLECTRCGSIFECRRCIQNIIRMHLATNLESVIGNKENG